MGAPVALRVSAMVSALAVVAAACAGVSAGDVLVAAPTTGANFTTSTLPAPNTTAVTSTAAPVSTSALAPATSAAPTTLTEAPTTTTVTAAPPTETIEPTSTTADPGPRQVVTQDWGTPFATAVDVTLYYPATLIERVGFHEAGRDGSRQMELLPDAVRPITLETRGRGTGSRTAADVAMDPGGELRSPVSGTVIRSGTYILYCKYTDDFVVIDPDDHPGWEVKMFHFQGLSVAPGDRVEAGVTVVGTNPAVLPFESQIDEFTANPSWPHVHIEVIDPSIPNRPSPGGGC